MNDADRALLVCAGLADSNAEVELRIAERTGCSISPSSMREVIRAAAKCLDEADRLSGVVNTSDPWAKDTGISIGRVRELRSDARRLLALILGDAAAGREDAT